MSAILQTIIGAVAALGGGFLAAWWQTSRADKVAQKIRAAERRESGLIALNSKITDVVGDLREITRTRRGHAAAGWHDDALKLVSGLIDFWEHNADRRDLGEGLGGDRDTRCCHNAGTWQPLS
jgi:hypothetical protein